MPRPRRRLAVRPVVDVLDDRCLLSAMTPAQVAGAYGLNSVKFNLNGQSIKGDGTGQTIAIVDAYDDPYLASDLHTFDQTFGLADPTLVQFNQNGSTNLAGVGTDDGWAGETALDVEWAHALAPGAKIVVVAANSATLGDLTTAVNTARNLAGVSVVSLSWGGAEFNGQTAYDSVFTTPAGHQGVTFVASSGDSGQQAGAQWPASVPGVLSVGGTTLRLGGSGYGSESLWSGSGGGYSQVYAEPSYQAKLQTTGARSSSDVLFDADPATGVAVYTTAPSTGRGQWEQVGGTSLGAPAWAAIVAIADQGRAAAGLGTLDGARQTLPTLYSLPSGDFHPVATTSTPGYYELIRFGRWTYLVYVPGTSTTPTLGSPNGSALVNGLAFGATAASTNAVASNATTAGSAVGVTTTGASTGAGTSRGPRNRWGRFDVPAEAAVATAPASAMPSIADLIALPPTSTTPTTAHHGSTSLFDLALQELGWERA